MDSSKKKKTCISGPIQRVQNRPPFSTKPIPLLSGDDDGGNHVHDGGFEDVEDEQSQLHCQTVTKEQMDFNIPESGREKRPEQIKILHFLAEGSFVRDLGQNLDLILMMDIELNLKLGSEFV